MIPSNIKPLTGIRFFAAAAVVVHHLKDPLAKLVESQDVRTILSWGHLAVPFFFILSGFILSHVYFPAYRFRDHGRFVWLRFARLWPVHVVTLAGLVLYIAGLTLVRGYVPAAKYDFTAIPLELLMVRQWFGSTLAWNAPAWSIQAEWFAYLFAFPVCAVVVRRLHNPWVIAGLIVMALGIQPWAETAMPLHSGKIVPLFVAGSLAYRLRALMPECKSAALLVNGAVLLAIPAMWFYHLPICFLAFTAIIFGLSYQRGAIARFLSSKALIHGGNISFSLYMVHNVVIVWTWELWGQTGATGWGPVIVTFVVSLLAAHLLWAWVEVPANKWLRNRGPK